MKNLMPFIVLILFFVLMAVVIIARFNYLLKKRVLDSGIPNETIFHILEQLSDPVVEALKWGMILFFAGLGLVVLQFIPYSGVDSPLPYGIEIIFIAMGFLLYYKLHSRNKKNQSKDKYTPS